MANLVPNVSVYGQIPLDGMGLVATWGYLDFEGGFDPFIPDHPDRAANLLIEQFEHADDLVNLVKPFALPAQELENVLNDLFNYRNIDYATGVVLDLMGEIVGEDRNNRSDEDYRAAIKIRPLINKSHGEPELIILALKQFTKATEVLYLEAHPAGVVLHFKTDFSVPSNIISSIESVALAGVKITITYSNNEPDFAFDGEGGYPPEPNTLGFGETGVGYEEEGGEIGERLT